MAQNDIEAFVYDVDGTFYHLGQMRRLMAREFGIEFLRAPLKTLREFKHVQAYRKAQEVLREANRGTNMDESVNEDLQLAHAAQSLGIGVNDLAPTIDAWIRERPKKILNQCVRVPVIDAIGILNGFKVPQAVYSDYPATEKLELFGVKDSIGIQVSSSDPNVGEFKPSPKGFLLTAELLGIEPERIAFVGDRPDVDEVGARAAGMKFIHVDEMTASVIAEARELDRAGAIARIARAAT